MRNNVFAHQERPTEVCVDDSIPVLGLKGDDIAQNVRACVVEQNVDLAKLGNGLFNCGLYFLFDHDVTLYGQSTATGLRLYFLFESD